MPNWYCLHREKFVPDDEWCRRCFVEKDHAPKMRLRMHCTDANLRLEKCNASSKFSE